MKKETERNVLVALVFFIILSLMFGWIAWEGKSLAKNICVEQFGEDYTMISWDAKEVNCGEVHQALYKVNEEPKRESIIQKI